MKNKFIYCALLVAATMLACKAKQSDILGTYFVEYSWGTEQLTIKSDNLYGQVVKINGGETIASEGLWEYDQLKSNIQLRNYFPVSDTLGRLNKDYKSDGPLIGLYMVRRENGRIVLRFHPDTDLVFKKIKDDQRNQDLD